MHLATGPGGWDASHMSNQGRTGRLAAVITIIAIATAGILVGRGSDTEEGEMLSYLSIVLYVAAALLAATTIRSSRKDGGGRQGPARPRAEDADEGLDASDIEREFDALEKEIDREENGVNIQP